MGVLTVTSTPEHPALPPVVTAPANWRRMHMPTLLDQYGPFAAHHLLHKVMAPADGGLEQYDIDWDDEIEGGQTKASTEGVGAKFNVEAADIGQTVRSAQPFP